MQPPSVGEQKGRPRIFNERLARGGLSPYGGVMMMNGTWGGGTGIVLLRSLESQGWPGLGWTWRA